MAIRLNIVTQFNDKELKRAQRDIANIGKGISRNLNMAVAGAAAGVVAMLGASAKAAVEDGKSQALLANQLRNTVGANEQLIGSVESSISKMQLMSSVADDEIRPAFSALVRATGDVSQATKLTSLALDIAAGTGKDLGAVSLALGKAVNGSTTSLLKLVPSIKGAADPMGELTRQFDGAAAAAANADPFQRLQIIFGNLQEQIGVALLPALQEVATYLASDVGQTELAKVVVVFKDIAVAAGESIIWIKDNYDLLVEFGKVALIIFGVGKAFAALKVIIDLATIAAGAFSVALNANAVGLLILALAGLVGGLLLVKDGLDKSALSAQSAESAYLKYVDSINNNPIKQVEASNLGYGIGLGGLSSMGGKPAPSVAGDPYARYKGLEAQYAGQQAAALKQRRLDAAAARRLAALVPPVPKGVKSGASAVSKAADAAKKALKAQNAAVADAVVELNKQRQAIIDANEEITKAYNESVESLTNFKTALSDASAGVKPLIAATRDIGQFEQAVISAFENMAETIKSGLADKTLTTDAAKNLSDYATKEKSVLIAMGKQRDDLFKKRSLAEGLIADVKASIASLGNITSLVKTQAKTVTQTVTQIINGLSVATTRTVEEVAGTDGLVANFQSVLAKTKAFAVQLKELRRLGLDKNLYQQIVDAGVDAGSVTAQEIIAGGAGTITELNTLFDDLNTVGTQIAEETAQVMYGAGVDVTNGLIAGLLSEEAALVTTAEKLANAFLTTFNSMVAKITVAPAVTQLEPEVATAVDGLQKVLSDKLVNLRSRLTSLGQIQGAGEMATAKSLMSQIRSTSSELTAVTPKTTTIIQNTTNNVIMKAAAMVNTKKTGQEVAISLAKFQGANS